jgi:diaminohydroxyphosphoribosylaminopyrimidine deaminase/5-amino-6-(5-phosphoribosylamino)uracil reductase
MNDDDAYMQRALLVARRGRGRTSPNPMVGALVVTDEGVVAGSGYHEVAGGPHAEVVALHAAGALARGATLYCTLEPCCHVGRTGPCTARILEAGIRRVVAASRDPNPRVAGGGFAELRKHGIEVREGICEYDAARLNAPFFTWIRTGRPYVVLKAALTMDNRVAGDRDERLLITSAAANRRIQRERAAIDAIGVGSSTILSDDPRLTARGAYRARPLTRVIFDRRLRTPPGARVFSTCASGPVIMMTTAAAVAAKPERASALERAGGEIEVIDERREERLESALGRLGARGVTSLLVEGGPTLHRAFWQAGLVDAVEMYIAPGAAPSGGAVSWLTARELSAASLLPVGVTQCGPDVCVQYVHRAD